MVNPVSTGAHIAKELSKRTFKVIALWTKTIPESQRQSSLDFRAFDSVEEQNDLEETLAVVKNAAKTFRVVACICGGEEGTIVTDASLRC